MSEKSTPSHTPLAPKREVAPTPQTQDLTQGNQAVQSQIRPPSGVDPGFDIPTLSALSTSGTETATIGHAAPVFADTMAMGSAKGPESGKATTHTGLGQSIDKLVNRSPTLTGHLTELQKNGWTIVKGANGKGTFAQRDLKTITIDSADLANPALVVQSLAHEAGHARHTLEPYQDFGKLTRQQYIDQNTQRHLRDEAEATIANLEVRDELSKGPNPVEIGVAGQGSPGYIAAYEEFQAGKINREQLVNAIAGQFGTERPSTQPLIDYKQYYGGTYQKHWDTYQPDYPAHQGP